MQYSLLQKSFSFLSLFCFLAIYGQNTFKLPENVVFYMEMNGQQLNKKVNWAKLNPVFQEVLKNENKTNIWNDYSKTGIKYDDKQIHYFIFNDSVKAYNAHFILEDEKRFQNFVNSATKEGLEVTKKATYSYVSLDEKTFIAWNQNHAFLKIINYTKPFKYDDLEDEADSTVVVDSVAAVPAMPHIENNSEENMADAEEKAFDYKEEIQYLEEDLAYYRESVKSSQSEIESIQKDIKYLKKYHKYPGEKVEADAVENEDSTMAPDEMDSADEESDKAYEKRMDSIKIDEFKIVSNLAESSFEDFFNSNFMIEVPQNTTKFKNSKADLFAFTNLGNIFKNSMNLYGMPNVGGVQNYMQKMYDADSSYNLYFEEDKVKLVTYYQHQDPKMQKSFAEMYDGKTSRKLPKLLSDQTIGFFSMNFNSYKSFDAMYDLIENVTENQEYQKEISLMVETMRIALDEKALSKIVPGNMIFILNDLAYKKVDYTDYDYDDDYNEVEVTKTKDVAMPNFTFAFETENEGYWNRFFDMLATNKNTAENFVKNGDSYAFKEKENTQFDQLIFTVKDGIVYITTSTANVGAKTQSGSTRKWSKEVGKHSISGWLNTPKLVEGLEKEFTDKKDTEIYRLLRKNLGEITYKTDVKSESIQTEMNYNIDNSSENSLMYFFDLFDEIYKITSPDKQPKKL